MEDLVIEAIQIYGADVFYLPRTPLSEEDTIYGEYPGSSFNSSYKIEAYMASVMGPDGASEMFGKFGLEIRDTMRFVVARRSFQRYIPNQTRPKEGDLIYVPQLTNLYEIKFVQEEKDFYSLGRRPPMFYYYELQVEMFKFNNERFNTGVPEIDQIARDYSYTISLDLDPTGAGTYVMGETVYQGADLASATATAKVKFWNSPQRILEIITIKGKFANDAVVIGTTSGATYPITDYNNKDFSAVVEELVDNKEIQEEANEVVDFDITNPFGTPE